MSNVQKAGEAALRVLEHLGNGGTYTVEFSMRDGGLVFRARRSDGANVEPLDVFALLAGASEVVEEAMNAMERGGK